MSCKKCKCKVCSCIKNDVPKIAVNGIVQNQNENDVVNIKVPTKTSQLINDSGFGQGEGLESNLDYIRVNGNLVPIINKVAQISVPTKTSDLENDSDYTTNAILTAHTSNKSNPHNVTKSQIGLGNVDNTSDLSKPVSTATQLALDFKIPTTDVKSEIIYEDLKPINSKAIEKYAVKKVNTIADLRNTNGEYDGQIITLLGYYEKGDKEILNYKYQSTQLTDDGGSVINNTLGSWIASFDKEINIKHFGAKCDNISNDSSYIQKSIDYAILNNSDICLDSMSLVEDYIYIDRKVDDRLFENYFTIKGYNNGGFSVNKNMFVFTSRYTYNGTPNSQLVKFESIFFNALDDYLGSYILDRNIFLRTYFINCSFSGLRLLTSPKYIQSIYLTNCNIRMFRGYFIESKERTYDLKISNCLIEQGETALYINEPYGCSISDNCIEGLYGTGILFNGSQGINISGNYFEGNAGGDINMLIGVLENRGINISGNMFYTTKPGVYSILWSKPKNAVSNGNSSLSLLHFFSNDNDFKNVIINDDALIELSNKKIIDRFLYEGEFTLTNNSSVVINKINSYYIRNGNEVKCSYICVITENTSSDAVVLSGLPFLPNSIGAFGYSNYNGTSMLINIDGAPNENKITLLKSDNTPVMFSELSGKGIKLHFTFFI